MLRKSLALLLVIMFNPAYAAGPQTIGLADRSLWPEPIQSAPAFDRASRGEILVFAAALNKIGNQDENALKLQFKIKQANLASVSRIKNQLSEKLLVAWKAAAQGCTPAELFCGKITTANDLLNQHYLTADKLPPAYGAWLANAQLFHDKYAGELLRLAALFPAVSSEIDTFSAIELDGSELPDRQFLLTFDDGPTAPKGSTDNLLAILDQLGLHSTFYMLGENLSARLKQQDKTVLASSFKNQCVALHGWQHQSHAKMANWQASVVDTQALVKRVFGQQYRPWFRPPYGQRLADSGNFFKANQLQVALWNIDSQDWNSRISGQEAAHRVLTLMLLWRHGVILFHDIHPKAAVAVPWLYEHTAKAAVVWKDCREY